MDLTVTTPTDQQFYDSLSPDLKRRVDESRAANEKLRQQRQQMQKIKVGLGEILHTAQENSLLKTYSAAQESADQEAPVWSDSLGSTGNKR